MYIHTLILLESCLFLKYLNITKWYVITVTVFIYSEIMLILFCDKPYHKNKIKVQKREDILFWGTVHSQGSNVPCQPVNLLVHTCSLMNSLQ